MEIKSKILDKKINALNVLFEMSIKEYITLAENITEKNEFQRKKVQKSKTVYALLKEDLKKGCTLPPIVLGVRTESLNDILDIKEIKDERILKLFTNYENFVILDGLQRTYTILSLINELKTTDQLELLEEIYKNPIRIEVFLGLKRIGILYRMLTLNTGQTPMSSRHQIEILYSGYKSASGLKLYTETDKKRNAEIGEYQFRDVVEGFNSYLDRDETGINRDDLLENIKNLEKLAQKDDTDLFSDYINCYHEFIVKIDELTNHWEYSGIEVFDEEDNKNVFGKNIIKIFTKAQALSGFGASMGILEDNEAINSFADIREYIKRLNFSDISSDEAMSNFLANLKEVSNRARNIGAEQRLYFSFFFRELFNSTGRSFLKIDYAIKEGFRTYKLKT